MITAIRLREYNKKAGNLLRTYTMASGAMFTAGDHGMPSTVQVVTSARDIAEAREIPQFEVLQFDSEVELRAYLTGEMEGRARVGLPAVRALVQDAKPPQPEPVAKARRVEAITAPVDPFAGDEADELDDEPDPVPAPPVAVPLPKPGRAVADILAPEPFPTPAPFPTPEPMPEPAAAPAPSGRKPNKGGKRVPR